nr:reverse transcriptase domain-containing protein [Tanacetum cinerariifolium]
MADNRTMAELLQAPTKGYEDAIVIPEIAANNFKLKHGLINLVQNKQFFGHDKEDPHAHIRYFNKITSTMRVPNIFPPSKTTNLRNEIMRFQQRFDESFYEAWDRFNDLLRACPHHGFSELHQLDTFYNALNVNDQDSLNSAADGNFLDKIPRECLKIIESKSKVRQSRAKAVVSKVSTSSSTPAISFDVAKLKDMVRALLLDKKNQSSAPAQSPTHAPVKAVEPNCVTCGGAHSYQNCPATSEKKDPPEVLMADNRTMAQLLLAPTVGCEDAIVIPEIAATNFELKHGLINLVQNKQFFGHDKEDPHAHIRYFNKITSTMRVPNDDLVSKFINQFFPPSKTTNLRNEITRFQQRFDESFSEAWDRFNDLLRACPHHGFSELHQLDTFYNALNVNDQDSLNSATAELKDIVRALLLDKKNQSSVQATSPTPAPIKAVESNCVTCGSTHSYQNYPATSGNVYQDNINEVRDTPRSDVAYKGPTIPTPSKVVKQGTKATKDPVQTPCPQSTTHVQPSVTQSETPVSEPIATPVSASMPNLKPSIPYPSRRENERRREQANEQIKKFYEIFKDMSFEINFTDALILMPKFASTLKALIGNKEKLSEMARTPMNEHCSVVILNKLPKKLGDPGKFLIPYEFPRMDECLALADLGASINLMPLSVWKEFSLPELTPTCITLELVDRSVSKPIGIAKDVKVKWTGRALINVHKGELTLRIGNEAITYNLDQTLRYSANYDQMTANKIGVTDEACEEYIQKVLGFSNVTTSGSPTPSDDPIVSTTSPTLTPFGDNDFLLFEEANAFLAILNSYPAPSLPNHEQSVPSFTNELKACEAKTIKSFVDEPPEVELKDLPPHLEFAFLEGKNKLPVIIAKELGEEEKATLIKVLKSHKRAIAWKLSDIQGINLEFCTHKILIEEDYKPTVQHQRHVNPKIHDVIKKEVEKLLDAGLIYPISDSPWVSPVHGLPKKGGFTVVKNEENELIPTRLVTGWRIPIDPRDQEKTTFTCPYGTFAYRRMPFGSGTLPSNTITNPKEELKGITTRSGVAYQGPIIPTPSKVVKQGNNVTKDQVQTLCSQSTAPVQPPVAQFETQTLVFEPIVAPVSALVPNLKPSIPYPSRCDNERCRDQANEQIEKFYEIFKDMSFEISFTDALILMPKFASTLKALIRNKEKLSEMARTPMNEHSSDNPTPHDDPIVSTTSTTLTPFGDSDFLLFEEADAFLAILNSEPLPPLPNHEQYLPSFKKELKVCDAKTVKSSVDEPPEVELKDLPPHLEYAFLEGDNKLPVIISKELGDEEKSALIKDLKSHKRAIAWKLSDIQGINLEFCTHKILMEEDYKPAMLERLTGNEFYCFLDGFFGYFQIPIDPRDQEKTTFTCPYETLAIDACLSVCAMHQAHFKGNSFENCLSRLDKMLQRCEDTNLCINWEKSHFMVKEGIVLGHKISKNRIKVDRAKVNVIAKLPHPTTVKGAENLAADHLSRLENPYENVHDLKEINETFPLETLSMVTFRGDSSASWFADFANYHAGNFIVKAYWALKQANFDLAVAGYHRKVQLNELNELCDHAYENSLIYKEKTKRIHDSNVGDRVLLFNSRLKIFSGKLKIRWSGPFTIAKVFPYGTVELSQANGPNFKVNGHCVALLWSGCTTIGSPGSPDFPNQ